MLICSRTTSNVIRLSKCMEPLLYIQFYNLQDIWKLHFTYFLHEGYNCYTETDVPAVLSHCTLSWCVIYGAHCRYEAQELYPHMEYNGGFELRLWCEGSIAHNTPAPCQDIKFRLKVSGYKKRRSYVISIQML